jgi:hypothetical protein
MMRVKPLLRLTRQRMSSRRRKVWVFAGLMAGALVPMLVVQSQASAYDAFCVGASWRAPSDKTMEEAGFPTALPSEIRNLWGDRPGGESTAADIADADKVMYQFYPDTNQKFLCAETSAAPCVISATVTLTYETWKSENWHIESEASGSLFNWVNLKVSGGYGQEWGNRESKSTTISNMAPYKLGDIIQPAHFIEWRERKGKVKGAYFNTGAICRTDGEQGEQYEWRDDTTDISFTFRNNIGEGNVWMKEGEKTSWEKAYSGQDGTSPPNYPPGWSDK